MFGRLKKLFGRSKMSSDAGGGKTGDAHRWEGRPPVDPAPAPVPPSPPTQAPPAPPSLGAPGHAAPAPEVPHVQLIFADGTVESVVPQGDEAEEIRYLVDNLLQPRDDGAAR